MSIWRLILREFAYRKVTASLAMLSVAIATACMVGSLLVLRAHERQTDTLLCAMRADVESRTRQLQEDYRKIMLEVGFNVFILPKGVRSMNPYDEEFSRAELSEAYVDKLANAKIITINHLLPSLTKRVAWPQQGMTIVLKGIRGEVTQGGKQRNEPLVQPVERGHAVLGFAVARQARLKAGDQIDLLGLKLSVARVEPYSGTPGDETVLIELSEAQRLLEKPGKINVIEAINCLAPQCHPDATGIPAINEEIERVLPDTHVMVDMGKAKTRIDTRKRAEEEKRQALAAEQQSRAAMHAPIAQVTSILSPVAMVAAGLWVAMLMLGNVRQRSGEIGVLRAVGVRGRQIMLLFLGKAMIVGLLGAAAGCAVGIGVAAVWCRGGETEMDFTSLLQPATLAVITAAAPLVAVLASWPPALLAARQDPAAVLREE